MSDSRTIQPNDLTHPSDADAGGERPAPGKVSRVQRLASRSTPSAAPAEADAPSPAYVAADAGHDDPFGLHLAGAAGVVQRREAGAGPEDVHQAAERGTRGAGGPLPHLGTIQQAFGSHDVGGIRAHTDGAAAEASRAIGAEAFATGDHVAFAGSPTLHTAAHEAAHVVQQRDGVHLAGGVGAAGDVYEQHADAVADRVVRGESAEALLGQVATGGSGERRGPVQRYEAGEHAKMGETHDELVKAYGPIQYTAIKGDTAASIAAKFKISVGQLEEANPGKLKKAPAAPGKPAADEVAVGTQLTVPQNLNAMARDAISGPTVKVTVNGVVMDYGTMVAMGGDLFSSPEEMAKTPAAELQAIAALVEEEKKTGKLVSTERWQTATKGRFLGLAAKNDQHFAPPNAAVAQVSGESTGDHKSSWEANHRKALAAARAGQKDTALLMNSFADHFLTDSFSAGHMFNKGDVMARFNKQLPTEGTGDKREFKDTAFFDTIAKLAFVGDVDKEFSKYETADSYALGWHPNINSASRFSSLLQGIHLEKPELLSSAVAKGVHDKLNTQPGGLPVENLVSDKWHLSGDNTLNAETLAVSKRAVAQSQQNVIGAFGGTGELDHAGLFKKVWDFTPRPTAEGKKMVTEAVSHGSDAKDNTLHVAIVNLIKENYLTIIAELVKLKKLRVA